MENKHVLRKKGNRHKEKRRIPKNDLTVCQENSIEESVGSKREELPDEKKIPEFTSLGVRIETFEEDYDRIIEEQAI